MKRSKVFQIAIGGGLMLSIISVRVIGQDPHRRGPHSEGMDSEMKREIRAYAEENIIPVLKEYRSEFEWELTEEEQKVIAEARSKRLERGQFRPPIHHEELSREERVAHRAMRSERRAQMEPLMRIIDNHEAYFDQLRSDLEQVREEWQEDIATIVESHGSNELFRKPFKHRGSKKPLGQVFFLLLDVEAEETSDVEAYPNPFSSTNTLSYHVKSGEVTINLLNNKGMIIETLLDEVREEGEHLLHVDLSQLNPGTYYYQVISISGVETKRVIKN